MSADQLSKDLSWQSSNLLCSVYVIHTLFSPREAILSHIIVPLHILSKRYMLCANAQFRGFINSFIVDFIRLLTITPSILSPSTRQPFHYHYRQSKAVHLSYNMNNQTLPVNDKHVVLCMFASDPSGWV